MTPGTFFQTKSVDARLERAYKRGTMDRLPHPALVWTANVLVPGSGLVLVGRLVAGGLLAVLWVSAVGVVLVGVLIWPDAASAAAVAPMGVTAGLLFAAAQGLLYVRGRQIRAYKVSDTRDEAFREVLAATLQGRLDDAEQACRALLARDPDDVEATLHLAWLACRRGRKGRAARLLRRARFLDDAGRWDFRIQREQAALAGRANPGRQR